MNFFHWMPVFVSCGTILNGENNSKNAGKFYKII